MPVSNHVLKLEYDEVLSDFTFNLNLRRYTKEKHGERLFRLEVGRLQLRSAGAAGAAGAGGAHGVGALGGDVDRDGRRAGAGATAGPGPGLGAEAGAGEGEGAEARAGGAAFVLRVRSWCRPEMFTDEMTVFIIFGQVLPVVWILFSPMIIDVL